jgi:DNA-directed RNA polymerase subunit M/transcription elongation factor TFIIS
MESALQPTKNKGTTKIASQRRARKKLSKVFRYNSASLSLSFPCLNVSSELINKKKRKRKGGREKNVTWTRTRAGNEQQTTFLECSIHQNAIRRRYVSSKFLYLIFGATREVHSINQEMRLEG